MKLEATVTHIVWADDSKPTDTVVDVDADYVTADYDSVYDYVRQELEAREECAVHEMVIENIDDIISDLESMEAS